MTLVEFLAPLKGSSHRERVLAILYYEHRYKGRDSLTVEGMRQGLKNARVPRSSRVNVADVVARSGHYVDSPGTEGNRRLWKLTDSGSQYVRQLLGLPGTEPEVEHDVGALVTVTSKIKDAEARNYVEEAVKCLQVAALRASVVFLWAGAVRALQQSLFAQESRRLNAALQKHDPKARKVTSMDHFAYIKDKVTLLAAQELGVLDKNEKDTLEEALNLRNRCGHPGKYKPGVKKVSSFVEDVVSIVFA